MPDSTATPLPDPNANNPDLSVVSNDAGPKFARAERYLIEMFVVGQDTEFRRLKTVLDDDALLPLPAGAVVKVRVVAANAAGESAPSAEVEMTVPALAEAA